MYGERGPVTHCDISFCVSIINKQLRHWKLESTHPPRDISSRSLNAASLPTSSGTECDAGGGEDTASLVKKTPVVVSAWRLKPNPLKQIYLEIRELNYTLTFFKAVLWLYLQVI